MDGSCPSEDRLVAYVDHRLHGDESAALERHFDRCPMCLALVAQLAPSAATWGEAIDAPADIAPGAMFDRYRVQARLGAGAMGVVYEAFDPELQRRVAIKLVRMSGTGAVLRDRARMHREAQAMARLSHPNLVPVLAVGTRGDDLFVVMELVEGSTLREWIDREQRGWRAIVRAYLAAARALAAAHAAGVVHRDFKPDNVLIANDGRVRVIDFGLARLIDGPALELSDAIAATEANSERTGLGTVVGTPAYMPPEQLLDASVDARADQFSLAVSLWEALFGARPFTGASLAALVDAVEHGRIRRTPARTGVPARLRRALVRALSARPDDRFPTMDALADELERSMRASRVWLVVTATAIAGSAALAMFAVQTDRCAPDPAPHWDADARGRMRDGFERSEAAIGGAAFTVDSVLDRRVAAWHETFARVCAAHEGVARSADFACLDVRRLELDAAIDVIADGDPEVLTRALDIVARLPAVEPCAVADPRLALLDPAAFVEEARELRSELAHARALGEAGRFDEAIADARDVLARAETIGHAALQAEAECRLGLLHTDASLPQEAVPLLEAAYFHAREIGHDEVVTDASLGLAEVLGHRLARTNEARPWLEHAAAAVEHWDTVETKARLERARGGTALRNNDIETAIVHFRRAVDLWSEHADGDDPRYAAAIDLLGSAMYSAGDFDEALELHLRALAMRERLFGDEHPFVGYSLNNVAMDLLELDQPESAIHHYEWAIDIAYATLGPDHLMYAGGNNNLGAAWGRLGEPAAAAAAFSAALPGFARLGEDHPDHAMVLANLGNAALASHDLGTAIDALSHALAIVERGYGIDDARARSHSAGLGRASSEMGAHRRAIQLLEHALGGASLPSYDEPSVAVFWVFLGQSRLASGDVPGARAALTTARERAATLKEVPDDLRGPLEALAAALERVDADVPPAGID